MNIHYATLDDCHLYNGTVVVIDVLRAFTTAPVAIARGAARIILVSSVDEAFALREQNTDARIMGEVDGVIVDGFDYGNSPFALMHEDLTGLTLIQRTTAGTQGVVRSVKADQIVVASFVNATATAIYVRERSPSDVTFVVTGAHEGLDGDEDLACGHYIEALLRGETPEQAPFIDRVKNSTWGRAFGTPSAPHLPQADMDAVLAFNSFDFALPVHREKGQLVIRSFNSLL